jgi:ABC-2 type transport system ATP-binding protein
MTGSSDPLIAATEVSITYPGKPQPAVDGLNLTVRRGELFGLLGPNAAGKTSTIRVLSTLMRPTRGQVTFDGVDIVARPQFVRSRIGLVPQEIALYPSLTGPENLRFFGTLCGLGGSLLKQRVHESLRFVGLEGNADQKVRTYSGGMKRRLNLAIALLHDPQLLFLDEPTVGIDAQSRLMVLSNLKELNQNGKTMIYTTHYLQEAETLCTRVAVMDQGRIIAEGNPGELTQSHPGIEDLEGLFFHLTGKALRD